MASWTAPSSLLERASPPVCDELYRAITADDKNAKAIRFQLETLWTSYREFASSHWFDEFPRQTQSRFWEMYLSASLQTSGFSLARLPDFAPDARITLNDGRDCWFEAVAVGPGEESNLDRVSEFAASNGGPVIAERVPESEIILRFTGGIKLKRRQRIRHIRQGIVGWRDPYVIAINSGKIQKSWFSHLRIPLILKTVFAIGDFQAVFDRDSMRIIDSGWTARPNVSRQSGQTTSTELFVSPRGAGISAIIYSNTHLGRLCADEKIVCGDDFVLVHNPFARSPLPRGFLGRGEEWVGRLDRDQVIVERLT